MPLEENILSNIVKRDNNNFDAVRLIAACMVIYSHANALVALELEGKDFIKDLIVFDNSGDIAVKIFFFLSGLVVTNSLLEKKSALQFVLARIFRIWPGLMFVVLVMALIFGPLMTKLPVGEYFRSADVLDYVKSNLLMDLRFELPGVFDGLRYSSVNGSLWTIPYEVGAYIILLSLFLLGFHKKTVLVFVLLFLLCIDPFLENRLIFSWRDASAGADDFGPCFAFGALLAVLKDRVVVGLNWVVGFFVLFLVFNRAEYSKYLFYASLFFAILYIFSRSFVLRFRLPVDISYGVYLWGWPVQQILVYSFPEMGVQVHRVSAIFLACFMGIFSWYLIEKPGIRFGGFVYKEIKNRVF